MSVEAPKPIENATVGQALVKWKTLQGIGKKKSTLHYHDECEKTIRDNWPDLNVKVALVPDSMCIEFAQRILHYSVPRYNNLVNYIRKIVPMASIIPRRKNCVVPKVVPTPEELQRVLAALDVAQQGNAGLVIRLLAQTGLRINEARQLRWEHVREDHLFLPGEITKNGRPRCVPFFEGTREVVDALKRVQKYHHDRRAFVLPQGRCDRALRYACAYVGLPRFSHHAFRHYFTTRCIQSGVDIPTVAKWLGHSDSGALLLKTYCHLLDEHGIEMAKRVKLKSPLPVVVGGADNVIPFNQQAGTATSGATVLDAAVVPVAVSG